MAVLRFGGFSSDEKIAKQAQILTQVLEKNNIRTKGSLLYMGYNAPWDVINRRNEVAFQIDWLIGRLSLFFRLFLTLRILFNHTSIFIQLVSFPIWLRVEGLLFFFLVLLFHLRQKLQFFWENPFVNMILYLKTYFLNEIIFGMCQYETKKVLLEFHNFTYHLINIMIILIISVSNIWYLNSFYFNLLDFFWITSIQGDYRTEIKTRLVFNDGLIDESKSGMERDWN